MRTVTVRDVFSHDEGTWDITRIRSYIRTHPGKLPAITLPMDSPDTRALLEHVRTRYAWEQARVDSLTDKELREPLLAVILSRNGEVLFIDGTHRLLRLDQDGAPSFRVRVIPAALADKFRVAIELKPQQEK